MLEYNSIPFSESTSSIEVSSSTEVATGGFNDEQAQIVPVEKNKTISVSNSPVSVFDVAAYILNKLGPISTIKLQKLVYYCQAWSLVWDEEPLFSERIEAWINGPVVRELFAFHRGVFQIDSIPIGIIGHLSKKQTETIDAVIDFYGKKTGQELVEISHLEEPWKLARKGLARDERGETEISLESMAEYYTSISVR